MQVRLPTLVPLASMLAKAGSTAVLPSLLDVNYKSILTLLTWRKTSLGVLFKLTFTYTEQDLHRTTQPE